MLNVDQTIDLLERIVEGREGYQYKIPDYEITLVDADGEEYTNTSHECVYSTPEGKPSCIVGYALYETDRDKFDEVHKWEWEYALANNRTPEVDTADSIHQVRELFDADAVNVLRGAQNLQDQSVPWGEVVDQVKAAHEKGYL